MSRPVPGAMSELWLHSQCPFCFKSGLVGLQEELTSILSSFHLWAGPAAGSGARCSGGTGSDMVLCLLLELESGGELDLAGHSKRHPQPSCRTGNAATGPSCITREPILICWVFNSVVSTMCKAAKMKLWVEDIYTSAHIWMPQKIPLISELERKKETENVSLGQLIHVHTCTLKNICMYTPVSFVSVNWLYIWIRVWVCLQTYVLCSSFFLSKHIDLWAVSVGAVLQFNMNKLFYQRNNFPLFWYSEYSTISHRHELNGMFQCQNNLKCDWPMPKSTKFVFTKTPQCTKCAKWQMYFAQTHCFFLVDIFGCSQHTLSLPGMFSLSLNHVVVGLKIGLKS